MNEFRRLATAAVVASLLATIAAFHARSEPIALSTPSGLNPGDSFRFLFVTTGTIQPLSTNIATYNSFVQSEAGGATYNGVAVNWKAIGSTDGVEARDNVGGFNTLVPVYLPSGTKLANDLTTNAGGLWSGSRLLSAPNESIDGSPTLASHVWTGSNPDGSSTPSHRLGNGDVVVGSPDFASIKWISSYTTSTPEYLSMYGLSDVLNSSSANALIWNTASGTWDASSTVWTTGTGGTFAFTDGDSVTFSGTGGGIVTISGSIQPSSITVSATSGTYTFVSSAGNLLTGTAGLAKSGGGTLILSGSNAFTGDTAVTGGTLLVNGVLASTTTSVSGGVLGGSGTVSGVVQAAAGGTIAPGMAVGSTGVLALNSLSGTDYAIAMDVGGTGAGQYDQLVTTGSLTYSGGTLQISMTGTYANGTAWDLFDFTTQSGTLAGIAPLVASDAAYDGLTWQMATTSTSVFDQRYGAGVWLSGWGSSGQRFIFNQADGVLTVVPEPSTFAMAAAGLAGCVLLRWRRARKAGRKPATAGSSRSGSR